MQNITIQSHFEYDELSVPLAFITIHSHSHSSSCQSLSLLLNRLPLSLFRSVCVSVLFLFVSFLREARVLCAYITRKNQQQQDISYNTCIQSGFRLKHHFRNPNQRHFINRFHPKKKKNIKSILPAKQLLVDFCIQPHISLFFLARHFVKSCLHGSFEWSAWNHSQDWKLSEHKGMAT